MKYKSGKSTSQKSSMGYGDTKSTNYTGIDKSMGNTCGGGGKKPRSGTVTKKSSVGNRRTQVPADRY